jgi:outer membrane protein
MSSIRYAAILLLGAFAPAVHAVGPVTTAPAADSTLTVGLGVAVVPKYSGSDKGKAMPILAVDYQNSNGFFASTMRGIGYQTKVGPLALSGALGYDGGREERDRRMGQGSDTLKGMGKIKGAALGVLGVGYEFDSGASIGLRAMLALSNRERGNTYELGMQAPLYKSEKNEVGVYSSLTYSDNKNMQTFYGVTRAQSAASGYSSYNAKAGFSRAGAGVNWGYKVDKSWSINSTVGVVGLMGDAADSPIAKRKTAPLVAVTANYAF